MPLVHQAWLKNAGLSSIPGHAPFGEHHESGDILCVPDADREMGTYIVGASGSGKSGLVENLAVRDIREGDRAVVFIDFHGDTAVNVIAATPPEHLHRVFLFDLTDESWPISLNLFTRDNLESSVAVRVAVNRILHLFHSLWPETAQQQNIRDFVRAAAMTLLANDNTTLHDMYRMFQEPAYRHQLVANVPWENVKSYWRDYEALTQSSRESRNQAVIGRLNALFMGDSLMANVLGQAPGRIDFQRIIANKEVVIVKLPGRHMEYESRLVGGTLLAQLQAAVFSDTDRNPVSVYVDEFQAIATPDIKMFFDEGRKYRIALTISNQRLSQLEAELKDAATTAKTVVCFHLGIEDSRSLAPLFSSMETYVRPEHIDRRACQRLMDDGCPEPVVQTFIDYYLRSLNGYRSSSQIKITHGGYGLRDHLGFWTSTHDPKTPIQTPRIDDPIPWLDDLFRRAMETGNPGLSIPVLAIAGFANTGPGFWPQVQRLSGDDPILLPGYQFPANLVVSGQFGEVWAKEPETGKEQLLHCIWSIRAVLDWLAVNPIGTESTVSDKEIGQILRGLPKRACMVRSGDDQTILFTLDNPPHVSGAELQQRLSDVLQHTRDTYARPRADVEAMHKTAAPKQANVPKSRWEQR